MASRGRCNLSKYFDLLFLQVAVTWVDTDLYAVVVGSSVFQAKRLMQNIWPWYERIQTKTNLAVYIW